MPGKLKWDISGKGVKPKQPGEGGGNNYEGPNLVKGSYPAKIKRMEVTKITSNTVNKGKPRIRILLEVQTDKIKGKEQYHGAPVWDGLNIIESGKPYVNAFLHALTDGSEKSKRAIEAVFWDEDKGDPEEYDDDDDDDSDEDDEDDDEDDEDEEPEPAAPVKKTTRGRAKKPF
jgi:phosphopantothenoylcysteine synthetase/decarboxylase